MGCKKGLSSHLSVILERKKKIYSTHFLAEVGTFSIIAIMVTLYHCGEMLLLLLDIAQGYREPLSHLEVIALMLHIVIYIIFIFIFILYLYFYTFLVIAFLLLCLRCSIYLIPLCTQLEGVFQFFHRLRSKYM